MGYRIIYIVLSYDKLTNIHIIDEICFSVTRRNRHFKILYEAVWYGRSLILFVFVQLEYCFENYIRLAHFLIRKGYIYILLVDIRIVCPIKTCSQLSTNSQCSGKVRNYVVCNFLSNESTKENQIETNRGSNRTFFDSLR